ncbi:hypothetical protein AB0B25_04165 [Nocardia sp. NPDC049190]|uniref:hypothetical protein n=1 Tax=Nocardia sp. NPDC049190 TaxID=3155650 RepID=UPI0033F8EC99
MTSTGPEAHVLVVGADPARSLLRIVTADLIQPESRHAAGKASAPVSPTEFILPRYRVPSPPRPRHPLRGLRYVLRKSRPSRT